MAVQYVSSSLILLLSVSSSFPVAAGLRRVNESVITSSDGMIQVVQPSDKDLKWTAPDWVQKVFLVPRELLQKPPHPGVVKVEISPTVAEFAGEFVHNSIDAAAGGGEHDEADIDEGDEEEPKNENIDVLFPGVPFGDLHAVATYMKEEANSFWSPLKRSTGKYRFLPHSKWGMEHGAFHLETGTFLGKLENPSDRMMKHKTLYAPSGWRGHLKVKGYEYLFALDLRKIDFRGPNERFFQVFNAAVIVGVQSLIDLLCQFTVVELGAVRLYAIRDYSFEQIPNEIREEEWRARISLFRNGLGGNYIFCKKQFDAFYDPPKFVSGFSRFQLRQEADVIAQIWNDLQ